MCDTPGNTSAMRTVEQLNSMHMTSGPFTVRRATLVDADNVAKCVEAAYGKWIPVIGTKPGPMLDDYRKVIAFDILFAAEQTGKIVGVLVLSEDAEGFLLESVAVHPDASGRGIGRALLALAENEARAGGYAQIYLYTHKMSRKSRGSDLES